MIASTPAGRSRQDFDQMQTWASRRQNGRAESWPSYDLNLASQTHPRNLSKLGNYLTSQG